MGFLNINSLPHLVEKLSDGDNIKITENSHGNRVGTVIKKIVEKADDVTKAIEQEVINDGHSFKVGTGDVDVSEDVEDGFGEIGIKGVTYQNCLNFTDDITFNLNLEYWNIRAIPSDKILVKPNTVYTMIIYVSNVTVSHNELLWIGDVSGNKNSITDEIIRKNVTMGINTFKFTTNSNPKDKAIRFQGSRFVEGVLTFKPLLLEGDHTNNPNLPSYFEGIVGIGDKIEILSNGKNLFDGKWESGEYTPTTGLKNPNSQKIRSVNSIKVTPNFKYTFSNNGVLRQTNVYVYDCNNVVIDYKNAVTQITPPSNASHITLDGGSSDRDLFQIEKSPTPTTYEPYQEDKTQILLDEPLMRLPNGVCDEITRDGKLIRRVGKVVLNGSENWYSNRVWSSGDYQASYIKITDKLMGKERFNFLCDRFAVTSQKLDSSSSIISECCFGEINNQVIYLTIKKEKLTSPDLTGFKQWLSQNPTTVYYQLAEPIMTELPVPYLRIFKDGHLTFNTLVAPESTHVVQLNKSAQIERSIREVQSLDSRVGKLESFYDDMMLETSHKLNLLTYDFEYAKERNNE